MRMAEQWAENTQKPVKPPTSPQCSTPSTRLAMFCFCTKRDAVSGGKGKQHNGQTILQVDMSVEQRYQLAKSVGMFIIATGRPASKEQLSGLLCRDFTT
jgi:hypothetical protein